MGRTFGTLERVADKLLLAFDKPQYYIEGFSFVEDIPNKEQEEVFPLLDSMPEPPAGFRLLHDNKLYGAPYEDAPEIIDVEVVEDIKLIKGDDDER